MIVAVSPSADPEKLKVMIKMKDELLGVFRNVPGRIIICLIPRALIRRSG